MMMVMMQIKSQTWFVFGTFLDIITALVAGCGVGRLASKGLHQYLEISSSGFKQFGFTLGPLPT